MTTSKELLAAIYHNACQLIFESYLVAADLANEEKDYEREEALRWLAENRRFPSPDQNDQEFISWRGWIWSDSCLAPYNYSCLEDISTVANQLGNLLYKVHYPTFEAAIEAFIAAWPQIKPKDSVNPPEPYLSSTCWTKCGSRFSCNGDCPNRGIEPDGLGLLGDPLPKGASSYDGRVYATQTDAEGCLQSILEQASPSLAKSLRVVLTAYGWAIQRND